MQRSAPHRGEGWRADARDRHARPHQGCDGEAGVRYTADFSGSGIAAGAVIFNAARTTTRFTTAGIPAGGIFAGAEDVKTDEQEAMYGGEAGEPLDPCYHQLCDDLTNINDEAFEQFKDAAVLAIGTFAQTNSSVNGTSKSAGTKPSDWFGDKLLR